MPGLSGSILAQGTEMIERALILDFDRSVAPFDGAALFARSSAAGFRGAWTSAS